EHAINPAISPAVWLALGAASSDQRQSRYVKNTSGAAKNSSARSNGSVCHDHSQYEGPLRYGTSASTPNANSVPINNTPPGPGADSDCMRVVTSEGARYNTAVERGNRTCYASRAVFGPAKGTGT